MGDILSGELDLIVLPYASLGLTLLLITILFVIPVILISFRNDYREKKYGVKHRTAKKKESQSLKSIEPDNHMKSE